MTYVRIDFSLFPGKIYWGDPQLHENFPTDRDEVSLWLDEDSLWLDEGEEIIEEGSLESDSGVFARESQEHGFLWFRKPGDVHSVGTVRNMPYALYEQGNEWIIRGLSLLFSLFSCSPGVRVIRQEKIDAVFRNTIPVTGSYSTVQEAVDALKTALST